MLKVEEDGAARKTVSVEGAMGPCIKLQEPGVSYPATQENARSLTLSISPPPITLEAARMQHLLAVNAGTPATPEPEDHGADLDPPPHNTPPPNEATEYTDHLPQQIQAPTEVQGPLESLRGEKPLCAIGQMSPAPTHTRGPDAHRRGVWLSPTCKRRSPPLGSQSPTIRRPMSAHIRHGCPFLTRVPCAP